MARLRKGEFTARSVRCKEVNPESKYIGKRIPVGSITQNLTFLDSNNIKVLEVQRYITPFGRIGASGKNDPDEIRIGNVLYHREQPTSPEPRLANKEINEILHKRGISALLTYAYWISNQIQKWNKERKERRVSSKG